MKKVHVGLILLTLGVGLVVIAAFASTVPDNGRVAIGFGGFILALCGGATAADAAS